MSVLDAGKSNRLLIVSATHESGFVSAGGAGFDVARHQTDRLRVAGVVVFVVLVSKLRAAWATTFSPPGPKRRRVVRPRAPSEPQ